MERVRSVLADAHEVDDRRRFFLAAVKARVFDRAGRAVVRELGDFLGRCVFRMDPLAIDVRHEYVRPVEHAIARMDAARAVEMDFGILGAYDFDIAHWNYLEFTARGCRSIIRRAVAGAHC